MPTRVSIIGLSALSWIAVGSAASAQDAASAQTDLYVPAKLVRRVTPDYPPIAFKAGRQGWVVVDFIISQSGEVLEPAVERSVGDVPFERAAVAAVRQWRYEPATLNGQPVEQSLTTMINFWLAEDAITNVTRPVLQRRYRGLVEALEARDFDDAQRRLEVLESMDSVNLYEEAWIWFAKYYFLEATNSPDVKERIRCLELAVARDQDYLEPELLVPAAQRLYVLYGQTLDLSGAVRIYKKLKESQVAQRAKSYEETLAAMTPSYERILAAVAGEQVFLLDGEIDEYGYWRRDLLRRSFSIENVAGRVEGLQVRCGRGIQRYTQIDEANVWTAPADRGPCAVFIKGDAGTTFVFEEYPLSYGGTLPN